MHGLSLISKAALVAAFSALLSVAAPSDAAALQEDARVLLVEIEVVVRDAEGEPVSGLEADRFQVLESSVQQEIERFEEVGPSQVVLLLDVSGSMEDRFWSARRAAWDLLRALGPATEVAVLGCGKEPLPVAALSAGRDQVARKLAALRLESDAETALLDCLEHAVGILQADSSRRGAIVAVSDGQETALSGELRAAALARLTDRLVSQSLRLEVLGYGPPGWLAELARATGGSWQVPGNGSRIVAQWARRLSHHYEIGYYPSSPHSGWQPVAVAVEGAGLEVDATEGYRLRRNFPRRAVD